ncbi:hypothetical protein [Pseudomonas sp. Hp2]|uniref:hypothetical protein n=1 Tax=Pseudomonas sp. Hp2 TaxID=701189 RepID=UPI00112E33B5|nr:hypothetical protein [Pseudomonas sp. Hp2]
MKAAYPRLAEAIQTQSLIAVQDALVELRAIAQVGYAPEFGNGKSEHEWDFELTNARSEDDLTPLAMVCFLYAQHKAQDDRLSCERLDGIAAYLIERGADPFSEQARRKSSRGYWDGTGRTLVEVFGQAQLPSSVRTRIEKVDERTYLDRRTWERQAA